MKNKGYKPQREWYGIGTILAIAAMVAVLVAVVVVNIVVLDGSNWQNMFMGMMNDLVSAIVIGLFVGIITTIVTNRIISVQKNMGRLRKWGITSIGTTLSTAKDIHLMFGGKHYPSEIKLMFLTGRTFFQEFKHQIIRAMNHGTKVKILIASGDSANEEYLDRVRIRYLSDKEKGFYAKEITDVVKALDEIKRYSINPQNLEVRHYLDEYQNNLRIATYDYNRERRVSYYWINLQPPNKEALKVSITHRGRVDWTSDNLDMDENLCCQFERGFDELWDRYSPENSGNIE